MSKPAGVSGFPRMCSLPQLRRWQFRVALFPLWRGHQLFWRRQGRRTTGDVVQANANSVSLTVTWP